MPNARWEKYDRDDRFRPYYLEDSYVLSILEDSSSISFEMEIVLTPLHPAYGPPKIGEHHCYRRGSLVFLNVDNRIWIERNKVLSSDITGDSDLGNIDIFLIRHPNDYRLEGSWGEVQISAKDASITLYS
jgi:hypothetical protein